MGLRSAIKAVPANLARTILGTFDFNGRSTRTELWTYWIVGQFIVFALSLAIAAAIGEPLTEEPSVAVTSSTLLYSVPMPALFSRRLHDMGWSGWFALLLPLLLIIVVISKDSEPVFVGIEQVDLGWPGTLLGIGIMLFMIVVSLVHSGWGDRDYGPDPRADEP